MVYQLIRPLLFRMDAERVHDYTLALMRRVGDSAAASAAVRRMFEIHDPRLETEAFGLTFKNPVGLAAGYDKDGTAVRGLSCLGFGHIEVGTLTPKPQPGNPLPRIHRVRGMDALINSMGFPSSGVEGLDVHRNGARVGVNIGKQKDTPLEEAAEEYALLLRSVYKQADYIVLNVSSPNTVGIRKLQSRALMEQLVATVTAERDRLSPRKPVLVKIAPDLTWPEIDDVLATISRYHIDGIIATNTTIRRDGVPEAQSSLPGGLSGPPLNKRSTEIIRYICGQTGGKLPIIGVGGISTPEDALEKLRAGARLVQIYTGLVYQGPSLPYQINARLLAEMDRQAVPGIRELSWNRAKVM